MTSKKRDPNSPPGPEVTVRLARREDLPAVLDIFNWAIVNTAASFNTEPETIEHFADQWESSADRFPWFVAENERAVVGFAKASRFHSRCGYAYTAEVTVYVHQSHPGRGIGTALYGELIPKLKAQGYRTLIAVIAIPNPASERLHARFDFRKIGILARVGWKNTDGIYGKEFTSASSRA